MITTENECVNCGLPCLGSSCPYWKVERIYCDICKRETTDKFREAEGRQYCPDCYEEVFEDDDYEEI